MARIPISGKSWREIRTTDGAFQSLFLPEWRFGTSLTSLFLTLLPLFARGFVRFVMTCSVPSAVTTQ